MKDCFILVVVCLSFFLRINAQEAHSDGSISAPYIKNKMCVSVNFSRMPLTSFHPNIIEGNIIKGGEMEFLYGINGWAEIGIGLDLSLSKKTNIQFPDYENPDIFHPTVSTMSIFQGYGGGLAKVHLLSTFRPDISIVDLYVSGLLGAYYGYIPMWSNFKVDFLAQCGIGLGVNPIKRWGISFEYGFNSKTKSYLLVGIDVRFSGPKKWQK